MDEKLVAAGLLETLESGDLDLRARLPAVFRKVDRIKRRAGWEPFRHGWVALDFSAWAWIECRSCGDGFAVQRRGSRALPEFCSRACKWADWRFRGWLDMAS